MNQTDVMTAEEVAEFLKCSKEHVARLARKHKIPAVKIGYLWRFSRTAIEAMFRVSSSAEEETQ